MVYICGETLQRLLVRRFFLFCARVCEGVGAGLGAEVIVPFQRDDDDSMHSLSGVEAELPRLNAANAVAKRRRTDPIDVEPASDEESIIPYEQPASGVEECESCDDDFEGIIPRKWKGEHKTRKLELLAKILEVSAADAAGMLASAAGRATDGGGDWNASVHMIAMQAAVD